MIDSKKITVALQQAICDVLSSQLGIDKNELLQSTQFAIQILKDDESGEAFGIHYTKKSTNALLLAASIGVQYRDWLMRTCKEPCSKENADQEVADRFYTCIDSIPAFQSEL